MKIAIQDSIMKVPRFKPFRETYQMTTFALSLSMMYLNPKTDTYRLLAIPFSVLTIAPMALMMLSDIYYSWLRSDIINITRHTTLLGPFLGGFFKMIVMYYKRKNAKAIIDEIDCDYESYNYMAQKYKEVALKNMKNSLIYVELLWVFVVCSCVLVFPTIAVVLNVYNYAFKSEPIKYMIHDVNIPFCEPEVRLQSPQYEIMFAYTMYCIILAILNFIGYDGFFGLAMHHACMKIDMFCMNLEDVMKSGNHNLHEKMVTLIHEHRRIFEYVNWIQDTFHIWLGLIFLATMVQICTCLYQLTEGLGFDLRYVIFVPASVLHIYLPCRHSAKLKAMSLETATRMYCSGWENVHDQSIRKIIIFMMARGQIPMEITAFNMVAFDMNLFVSIMNTTYSMYTLMRS